jgi:predicted nuclease with TOPRIM domain
MPIIDDPDFLTNRSKQLGAVDELAHLRTRLVDLQGELLNRMNERRQLIQRVVEQDVAKQQQAGRASRTAAVQRARASDEVRSFDQNMTSLREKIRRLEIEIERERLSIEIAITTGTDRSLDLTPRRGAA